VANLVNQEGTGFGAEQNEVTLVLRTGEVVSVPRLSKREIADVIFDHAMKVRLALHANR
jgi:phosphopantothenoylcysteine synthetase/decarboxylase